MWPSTLQRLPKRMLHVYWKMQDERLTRFELRQCKRPQPLVKLHVPRYSACAKRHSECAMTQQLQWQLRNRSFGLCKRPVLRPPRQPRPRRRRRLKRVLQQRRRLRQHRLLRCYQRFRPPLLARRALSQPQLHQQHQALAFRPLQRRLLRQHSVSRHLRYLHRLRRLHLASLPPPLLGLRSVSHRRQLHPRQRQPSVVLPPPPPLRRLQPHPLA